MRGVTIGERVWTWVDLAIGVTVFVGFLGGGTIAYRLKGPAGLIPVVILFATILFGVHEFGDVEAEKARRRAEQRDDDQAEARAESSST